MKTDLCNAIMEIIPDESAKITLNMVKCRNLSIEDHGKHFQHIL